MAICNNKKCSLSECDQPETCTAYVPVITNADRIRTMSDEELKEFLCSIMKCEFCKFEGWGGCELLEWLRQPAEEGNNGETE